MFAWLKSLWEKVKPSFKKRLFDVIDLYLVPALGVLLRQKKDEIIKSLNEFSPEENALKAGDWAKEIIERQL